MHKRGKFKRRAAACTRPVRAGMLAPCGPTPAHSRGGRAAVVACPPGRLGSGSLAPRGGAGDCRAGAAAVRRLRVARGQGPRAALGWGGEGPAASSWRMGFDMRWRKRVNRSELNKGNGN